jgi:hypothetical protein
MGDATLYCIYAIYVCVVSCRVVSCRVMSRVGRYVVYFFHFIIVCDVNSCVGPYPYF